MTKDNLDKEYGPERAVIVRRLIVLWVCGCFTALILAILGY